VSSLDTTTAKRAYLAAKNTPPITMSQRRIIASDVAGTNIDLFKSLPEIKTVDFLSSFKAFNISVSTLRRTTKIYFG
jgi:hypothetical protein